MLELIGLLILLAFGMAALGIILGVIGYIFIGCAHLFIYIHSGISGLCNKINKTALSKDVRHTIR